MFIEINESIFRKLLDEIQKHDPSSKETFNPTIRFDTEQEYYFFRNNLIKDVIYFAEKLNYKSGYLVHTPITDIIEKGWDYKWGVVAYLELPTGQVSWHIESPDIIYDGHNYKDKQERINKFLNK